MNDPVHPTTEKLVRALSRCPATVKELAADVGISESRVRELINHTIVGVESDGKKPAKFWIPEVDAENMVDDSAPEPKADNDEEMAKIDEAEARKDGLSFEDLLKAGRCPHCGGDHSSQTAAGAEGTFLGDACNLCHECGVTYNNITGEVVPADKKVRKCLNPQPKIDAKVAAVEAAGGTLTYGSRRWTITLGDKVRVLSSREFSEYDGEEILNLVRV